MVAYTIEGQVEQQVEPVTYGYECDTCDLSHAATFDTVEAASWFLETWAAQGMRTWRVK